MLDDTTRERACGSCSACCTTHSVRSIGKPAQQTCPHVALGGGCGVYTTTKPHECGNYLCAWLRKEVPIEYAPEATGVVIDHWRMGFYDHVIVEAFICRSARTRRQHSAFMKSFIATFSHAVVVYRANNRLKDRVYFPSELPEHIRLEIVKRLSLRTA